MPVHSIDEFVSQLQGCTTFEALFSAYQNEIQAEGYQNIVFGRLGTRADSVELPFGVVPKDVPKQYFQENLWQDDPILAISRTMTRPFTWIDEMARGGHSKDAERVMKISAEAGVKGGLTIPIHGPGSRWDVISLSMRDNGELDASRIHIVTIKTFAMLQRYLVLEERHKRRKDLAQAQGDVHSEKATPRGDDARLSPCGHVQHGEGAGVISDAECRAIVLADIGWRRYCAGLVELNQRIPQIVGNAELEEFLDRGLIEEVPDDDHFRYFFKPTPIGLSHIRLCPCVPAMREIVLKDYVNLYEKPVE